jgi:alpha-tubulin suppressor-like RCC1 family protein
MKGHTRIAWFLVTALGTAATTLAACADDTSATVEPVEASAEAASDAAQASLADASTDGATGDAGTSDAHVAYDGGPTPTVECAVSPCVVRLVRGQRHYCAVLSDGAVRCWGEPTLLGASPESLDAGPDATPGATPVVVEGVNDVVDIEATWDRTCAVRKDGGVDCWGDSEPRPTRIAVPTSTGLTARIALSPMQWDGSYTNCAVSPDGESVCWGNPYFLEADPQILSVPGGKAKAPALPFSVDTMGPGAGFVIDENGVLLSFGTAPPYGYLLGRETANYADYTPRRVDSLASVRSFSAAVSHACAVTVDARLYCWGAAGEAMLGSGYLSNEEVPVEVALPAGTWPTDVSAGYAHSCVRAADGSVRCWGGHNRFGERGTQAEDWAYTPQVAQGTPEDVVSVAAGFYSTCVLTRAGAVWCWGYNGYGVLGNGTRDQDRHPVPAPVAFP